MNEDVVDVLLIGSGIMSASLGVMLKELDPSLTIRLLEVTKDFATEASHGWNNAGTGHAGICELSHPPNRNVDGSVNVSHAVKIFEECEHSRQLWAYAVERGIITDLRGCLNQVPHISFVHGETQVAFLKERHKAMSAHHFFSKMEYSTDRNRIAKWAPLLLEGRDPDTAIAATKMDEGTDVNFGAIAAQFVGWLERQEGCAALSRQKVVDLSETDEGWRVMVEDVRTGRLYEMRARFVFVGAGGGSLPLLQKAKLPEVRGLGGFPIGGQWLVCQSPAVVAKHQAKVYGQAFEAAPTMEVPHLDTRMLDGKRSLLFGPFAAWTTKFLHGSGSLLDLPGSIRPHNLTTLMKVSTGNLPLVKYLVQQGSQSMKERMEVLRDFYPRAREEDWKLMDAGIRVQTIKNEEGEASIVHYGTEVICAENKSLAALLGASPGASASSHTGLQVIRECFPQLLEDEGAQRMKAMIPNYDEDLKAPDAANRYQELASRAMSVLGLRI